MVLEKRERRLFFKLYLGLMIWVNNKYKVVEGYPTVLDQNRCNMNLTSEIRDFVFADPDIIDEYLNQADDLSNAERDIITLWRKHFICDVFVFMRNLQKYSVLMNVDDDNNTRLYGVLGITDPIIDLFTGKQLPIVMRTILLPFKGKIIYDGLIQSDKASIGPNMRKSLNESYRLAKNNYGIATSLPLSPLMM
jgi:hypothetical protein